MKLVLDSGIVSLDAGKYLTSGGVIEIFSGATPTITGPDDVTEGATEQITGTNLAGVSVLKLEAGSFSFTQTIDAQDATTIDFDAESGVNSATVGVPVSGCPTTPTVTALGITPYVTQVNVDGVTRALDIDPEAGFACVQTTTAVADTTIGESFFATDIVTVEDDHQVYGPTLVSGVTITYFDDGTWTVSDPDVTLNFDVVYFTPSTGQHAVVAFTILPDAVATITGTITAFATESDIVAGGKTIIVTLENDTWKVAGTGPIGSTADTQEIIDGATAALTPTFGWNNEVRDKALTSEIARTSPTVMTWALGAQAGYNISILESITFTIPSAGLTSGGDPVVATPNFTILTDDGVLAAGSSITQSVVESIIETIVS